ncbi:MAG: SIR2 family protein [Acidobacteria bacterium]|nr:SIR2 family protein [Acidobacteriota bacterium]
MPDELEESARKGAVVVLAGAGVSAGRPSALPGWKALNAAIASALCRRLESSVDRPGWLSKLMPVIAAERDADRFPPDYQAQLIEEMCGDRYFRALQSLDVDVVNSSHDAIAALAAGGALRAVVTTNFDRLIERALQQRGVACLVAYDDAGYVGMLERLRAGGGPLPVIKIHGCVSDHRSMIDTLKQRKLGRSQHLVACLNELCAGYWVYAGFSADDLEADPSYLGLVAGARRSAGATFLVHPGSSGPRRGAQILKEAYGTNGHFEIATVPGYLAPVCQTLGISEPVWNREETTAGLAKFEENLKKWAQALSPVAAGLCLAALLEAIGQADAAVRILDRLVRKELYEERGTADYCTMQLQYGRLGAAWGRFVAVPDMNGAQSNASVETTQSLLRLHGSEAGFAAASWLACLWLWLNDGHQASVIAITLLRGILEGKWEGLQPRSDEELADAWLAAAQVCVLNANERMVSIGVATAQRALDGARRSGDVVRAARVVAVHALLLSATSEDVPGLLTADDAEFADAVRVGDGFALGMRELAIGRWHVGVGGLAIAREASGESVAQVAIAHLEQAILHFRNQGMDPWVLFSLIQLAKAHMDLRQFDQAQAFVDQVAEGLERFPVLATHLHEAIGQGRMMWGDVNALESFQSALDTAEESGLFARRETLAHYLSSGQRE